MASPRIRQLEIRIRELDATLLPLVTPPPAPPPPPNRHEQDRIRAFIVLAHAEVEDCIEDLVLNAADAVITKWKSDGVARPVLQALIAYAEPKDLSDGWFKQLQADRYENVRQKFGRLVDENMGIRPRNALKLLLSVGVPRIDIDDLWLTELSEFGKERGLIAHRSVVGATLLPDAGRARMRVRVVVRGLHDVDRSLRRLGRGRANTRSFADTDRSLKGRHEILRRPS
jgi:hypothetical protein